MSLNYCINCKLKSVAAKHLNNQECYEQGNNSVQVSFKKGEIIFKQDALSTNVVYLRTGLVKIHMHGPVREKILRVTKAPSYLGIPTTFADKINQFSATAIEDTSVCFIDISTFKKFINSNGSFAYEIIMELCRNELFDYQRNTNIAQKQIPGLVAEIIMCFSEKIYNNDKFELPLTRSEIGDLVGTTRESVSRVLADLSKENIIKLDSNSMEIMQREQLKKICEKG